MKMNTTRKSPAKTSRRMVSGLYDLIGTMVSTLVIIVMIFTFLVRGVAVDGTSMVPTLKNNDRLFLSRLSSEYTYGDIVVIDRYIDEPLIKRVVAISGDIVEITETGQLLVNGQVQEEPYTIGETVPRDMNGPVLVPPGYVFVLGDNRAISNDSRSAEIGMISVKDIVGKAIWRYWPLPSFGGVYRK